jgi:hypothetical protein
LRLGENSNLSTGRRQDANRKSRRSRKLYECPIDPLRLLSVVLLSRKRMLWGPVDEIGRDETKGLMLELMRELSKDDIGTLSMNEDVPQYCRMNDSRNVKAKIICALTRMCEYTYSYLDHDSSRVDPSAAEE